MSTTTNRFLMPSFWRGVGRALDLTGGGAFHLEPPGLTPAQRDARALAGDWKRVGGHLRHAAECIAADVNGPRGTVHDGALQG